MKFNPVAVKDFHDLMMCIKCKTTLCLKAHGYQWWILQLLWILSFALSILFNSKFVDPARKKKPFSADKREQLVRRSSKLVTVCSSYTSYRHNAKYFHTCMSLESCPVYTTRPTKNAIE